MQLGWLASNDWKRMHTKSSCAITACLAARLFRNTACRLHECTLLTIKSSWPNAAEMVPKPHQIKGGLGLVSCCSASLASPVCTIITAASFVASADSTPACYLRSCHGPLRMHSSADCECAFSQHRLQLCCSAQVCN